MASKIVTFSGLAVDPLCLYPQQIRLVDIAHSLSNLCRFTGHCRSFYSVAQHCLHVVDFLCKKGVSSRNTLLWGLLHDASEAYLADVSRPVKQSPEFAEYRVIEARVQRAVAEAFSLSEEMPEAVHEADVACFTGEAREIMPNHPEFAKWKGDRGYPGGPFTCQSPTTAATQFWLCYFDILRSYPND